MTETDNYQHTPENENTYRIRAAVRALLSPGMWLVVAMQAVTLVLLASAANDGSSGLRPLFGAASFFLFLYFTSGMFQSLATSRDAISVRDVMLNGARVFNRFMVMGLKAFLLFGFILFLVVAPLGAELQSILKDYPWFWGLSMAVMGVVLVYWLPIAFVTGHFGLTQTLLSALKVQQQRLQQLPYPALLILTPNLVGLAIPTERLLTGAVLISALSEILGWVAYTYCTEYVARNRDKVLIASKF
ncbi:MAG: hypothetical protein OEZ10_08820 [Gammaproteobacteria bacterium]|nr:hypothetical protein [Gammaproteobacteria bacterium]